ncbi:MAG TPA: hypothetical protein VKU38_06975 [Ktedonobacteraceae bacterium]|nr:hypothetical protein [Ktedonobacteraceae bacterium]
MGKLQKKKESVEHRWFERARPSRSLEFAPIPVSVDGQRKRLPVQDASLWHLFTSWLSFYTIQIRWRIERRIARLFHRRWGTK